MTIALFLAVLFAAMTLGVPIAFALMLTALALMVQLDFFDAQLLAMNVQAGFDNFPLLAVPFFVLAGELMNAGGLSRRIIDLARAFVGHVQGGLGYVAIAAALLLASMSGSAIADTAALATLLLPMMRKQNYPDGYSAGLIGAGGIIAPIIPPSLPMVIYGVTTNTSISKLFMAGIVPGVMMATALVLVWRRIAGSNTLPVAEKVGWPERRRVLARSLWALMMPVIIIGGLRFGFFTPTEAAAVAAVYALFVAVFIYRELTPKGLYRVLVDASRTTGVVMFLCGGAMAASYMITLADLPNQLADVMGPLLSNPVLFMAVVCVFLLAVGMVMDLTPTILILAPVLAPLAAKAGLDPVYFGFVFIFTGCLGLLTPPVGTVLNVVAGVGRLRMEPVIKGVLPFLAIYFSMLVLLILFPSIVLGPLKLMF
ncbi:MAG TPA: TRAP transporter large permease subunit [Hydrogenophaga sp.]|uniref:TRAP transporter large permease n=1 Tax=Hydrogenophaga sp. TaxID=1904254 RepID=UPI002D0B3C79|nr:TRAP transporter large permease subunit [Hydrogenophaga sp.]HMN93237.1 TRAP transporter large permease subunit [Hydrogenophaga sp.]HMP11471.1 TRAP transporter large permease subunit [Hydrogenophaga sp.]